MATYTWTRTREQLRDMILRKLGVIGAGDTATAEDAAITYEAIDARLKELHKLGILWFNVSGAQTSVSLAAGVATATISATDYLFPVTLMLVVGTQQYPVTLIGHREYQAITDKATTGEPSKAFINGSTVYLWPVPQSAYTAKLTYQAIAADTESNAAADVPVSMIRAFATVVAADLVDDFGLPDNRASRIFSQQEAAVRTLRALNAEAVDSTPVTPEWF